MTVMQAMPMPEAFFRDTGQGARFCLFHQPPEGQPVRGGLLYVHPFAEELNLSRRMAAAQARAFAGAGFAVLQVDLQGCGDSAGDFADASWTQWQDDVQQALAWLAHRLNRPVGLWGLRAGCLLAAGAARRTAHTPAHLLLWQPVCSGQQHLNQFLRLGLATDIARGIRPVSTGQLAQQLAQGDAVEVAGYRLSPSLAHGLAQATLDDLPLGSQVCCLEMSHTTQAALSPALTAQLVRWQGAGCQVQAAVIEGSAFWQVAEPVACPALLAASLAGVERMA